MPWLRESIMSTAARYEPRYTVDDYQQWQGDWELIHGVAISMTPSPFGRHAKALTDMAAAFKHAVDNATRRSADCQAVVLTEIDWIVGSDTVVRPDLVVVCGGVPERHVESPPAIVVEVLSPSTRDRDCTVKKDLYLRAGVSWYVLIDPDNNTRDVLERVGTAGQVAWHQHQATNRCTLTVCDDCQIELAL